VTINRRLFITAASAALATSAIGAPMKILGSKSKDIETKVQIFSIETTMKFDDVARTLRVICGQGATTQNKSSIQAIVSKDSPLLYDTFVRFLLGRIGEVSDVTDTSLLTKSGVSVPVSVGEEIPYVRELFIGSYAKGWRNTKRKGIIKTGYDIDVKPTLRKDGTIQLAYAQRLSTLIHSKTVGLGDGKIHRPRVRETAAAFDANVGRGQAVLYAQFDENGGKTMQTPHSVVVTLVAPKVGR
jgi:hypothetical protein